MYDALVRLDRELISLVIECLLQKHSALFLTKDLATADDLGARFEAAFNDIVSEQFGIPEASVALKFSTANPSFIRHANGAWIFFYPVNDITPDEVGSFPDSVFWPTQGLDYFRVSFPHWSKLRNEGHIWHPLSEVTSVREADSAWAHLLNDDALD